MEAEICNNPEALKAMVACVDVTKRLRKIAHQLGVQGRPWLRALPSRRGLQSHKLVSVLSSIVYRCDVYAQFQNVRTFQKVHEASKRKRHRAGQQAVGERELELTKARMFARLATEHFRTVADDKRIFSMPTPKVAGTPFLRTWARQILSA